MTPQLFVDLDGVLADFDGHFEKVFGIRPIQDTYEPIDMFQKIKAHGSFYRDLPPLPGALDFWAALWTLHPRPVVLTGFPRSVPEASLQKIDWVQSHLGPWTTVIPCHSVNKHQYGNPGDVLIDDRTKYERYWRRMGGEFIHHTSQSLSIQRVSSLLASRAYNRAVDTRFDPPCSPVVRF